VLEKGMVVNFAIEAKGLKKTFVAGWLRKRRKEALRGVDLSVPEGAFWGLLGPNGAGKTTLLSVIANLLIPEQGEVRVLGWDLRKNAGAVRRRINLSSGHANFLWSLTVKENLEYYAMLYGLAGNRRRQRVEELLELFDLQAFAKVRFEELSTGTKQKLSLAKSLVNDPALLLLDEPTVGLDPDVARRIRDSVRRLHRERGTTLLMTTHNMKEAETLCEQIAFIKDGVIKNVGKPQDLKDELRLGDTISIAFSGTLGTEALERLQGTYAVQTSDSLCRILVDDHHKRLPPILDLLMAGRVLIHDLRIQESDLEDVFIAYTK
jgi:ABC-2 type transport system ATP-binding protein